MDPEAIDNLPSDCVASADKKSTRHIERVSVGAQDTKHSLEYTADVQPVGISRHNLLIDLSLEERHRLELKLKRKIDLRLMPLIILIYILNYLDRNNIAAAKLAGILEDLDLKGDQFQTSVSILFVGYLLMQIPSNLLLNKLGKPASYLCICMTVWGLVSGATGAVKTYSQLLVCRFFLGFIEAAYFPGCLFYLSTWYTKKEIAFRTAILYSGSLLSGAFGGLIAAGIENGLNGARGLLAWRWLFIIEGVMTVVVALVAIWILPNFPRTTSWLSEEEKQMAIYRLEADVGEDDWVNSKEQTFFHGFWLAVKDVKCWLLLCTIYGATSSGSVTTFFPTVVETLGYGSTTTLLLTAPPYVLAVAATWLNSWHSDRVQERWLHIALPPLVAVVAFALAAGTTSFAPRYVAMLLMVAGSYSGYVVALGYISNVIPRPPAKRAAALAGINALSNLCQIYNPYMYYSSAAPRYIVAMCVNAGTALMSFCMATVLRYYLARINQKLDHGTAVMESGRDLNHEERRKMAEEHGLPPEVLDSGFRFLL